MESAGIRLACDVLRITDPSNRPLAYFLLVAFGMHGAAIWLVKAPPLRTEAPPRVLDFRVVLNVPPAAIPTDEQPEKVTLPPDIRPRERRDAPSPEQVAPRPAIADPPERADDRPAVAPDQLLRDFEPADPAPNPRFGGRPETHSLFKPQRLVRPPEPPAPWSRGIWRRAAVADEERFNVIDGRSVWIRRYDNGDVQVCERPYDSLLNQWDDHLPFLCER